MKVFNFIVSLILYITQQDQSDLLLILKKYQNYQNVLLGSSIPDTNIHNLSSLLILFEHEKDYQFICDILRNNKLTDQQNKFKQSHQFQVLFKEIYDETQNEKEYLNILEKIRLFVCQYDMFGQQNLSDELKQDVNFERQVGKALQIKSKMIVKEENYILLWITFQILIIYFIYYIITFFMQKNNTNLVYKLKEIYFLLRERWGKVKV